MLRYIFVSLILFLNFDEGRWRAAIIATGTVAMI